MLPLLLLLAAPAPRAAPAAQAPPAARHDAAEERVHNDWAWLARYRDANAALPAPSPNVKRIVFMGDSITRGWIEKAPGLFTAGRLDRGISGQTTPQVLVRFRQDVIDLRPAAVHIMAVTNDIAGNTGPMSDEDTQANIRSMVELAQAHGIRVILASIPPADRYPWRPGLDTGPHIARLNAWLRAYAAGRGATLCRLLVGDARPGAGCRAGDARRAVIRSRTPHRGRLCRDDPRGETGDPRGAVATAGALPCAVTCSRTSDA